MLIEDELYTERLKGKCDQENIIRRVTRLQNHESGTYEHSQGQQELRDQSHTVLKKVAQDARGLAGKMAVDLNAIQQFVGR